MIRKKNLLERIQILEEQSTITIWNETMSYCKTISQLDLIRILLKHLKLSITLEPKYQDGLDDFVVKDQK